MEDEVLNHEEIVEEKYYMLGIEVSYEEMDRLSCLQAQGKELKIVDGKVVAVDRQPTDAELLTKRIEKIKSRLESLTQDFIQILCGADFGTYFDDNGNVVKIADDRKKEFQTLHNELRFLQGKEPRKYE